MKKESGYSLLELSVALGIAAVLAAPTGYDAKVEGSHNNSLEVLASGNVFSDLEDVNLINPEPGDVIVFNGLEWVNQKLSFNFLSDVLLSIIPSQGDLIVFENGKWVNKSTPAPELANLENVEITNPKAGQSLVWNGTKWVNSVSGMAGEVQMWSESSAPEGWLVADGSAVSRTTYAELFATIGTTYGEGNGSTTFNLPDFSGRAGVGLDSTQTEFNSLGKTGGAKTHTLTVSEIPSHTHTQDPHGHSGSAASAGAHTHTGSATSAGEHTHTGSAVAAGAHTHGGSTRNDGGHTKCCGTTQLSSSVSNTGGSGQPQHSHTATLSTAGDHSHTVTVDSGGGHSHTLTISDSTAVNQNTGGGTAHNNLKPYITTIYIIKY